MRARRHCKAELCALLVKPLLAALLRVGRRGRELGRDARKTRLEALLLVGIVGWRLQ